MNPLVTLKFINTDTQIPQRFPDQNADITLLLNNGKETFALSSNLLKKRSKYFETQLLNKDAKFKVIPGKYDSQVFLKILKCFYGDVYNIYKDEEFFLAFNISHFLQINNFIGILQDSMFENFHKMNFLILYTLAEQFEIDLLREKCFDYLDEHPEQWRIILPIQKLESYRQTYFDNHQNKPTADVPINILHLKEEILIKLLRYHNERKDKISFPEKFLSPDDIFTIINWYVKIRFQCQDERQLNASRLIHQLFVLEDICSDNGAKKLFSFMSKSARSSSNISQITNSSSINEKQHKIIIDLTRENDDLKKELQNVKEENFEIKSKYSLLEVRIEVLEKIIENSKIPSRIQEKSYIKQEIETSQFMNRPLGKSFLSNVSEISDAQFFKNQLQFNSSPQTVFSVSEISYLSDILNAKIYQQIKFKLLYRGSENNFCSISEEQLITIKKASSILILIRSVENDTVFGIFNEHTKIQVINFQARKRVDYKKELKLTINSQYLLKLGNDLEIFVDCCNKKNNICNSINGLGCLAGKNEFQVDELEIYECSIHNEIM